MLLLYQNKLFTPWIVCFLFIYKHFEGHYSLTFLGLKDTGRLFALKSTHLFCFYQNHADLYTLAMKQFFQYHSSTVFDAFVYGFQCKSQVQRCRGF